MYSGWDIFTSSPVSFVTAEVKKVVADLFHADSTQVEAKCIKRKMRLLE